MPACPIHGGREQWQSQQKWWTWKYSGELRVWLSLSLCARMCGRWLVGSAMRSGPSLACSAGHLRSHFIGKSVCFDSSEHCGGFTSSRVAWCSMPCWVAECVAVMVTDVGLSRWLVDYGGRRTGSPEHFACAVKLRDQWASDLAPRWLGDFGPQGWRARCCLPRQFAQSVSPWRANRGAPPHNHAHRQTRTDTSARILVACELAHRQSVNQTVSESSSQSIFRAFVRMSLKIIVRKVAKRTTRSDRWATAFFCACHAGIRVIFEVNFSVSVVGALFVRRIACRYGSPSSCGPTTMTCRRTHCAISCSVCCMSARR